MLTKFRILLLLCLLPGLYSCATNTSGSLSPVRELPDASHPFIATPRVGKADSITVIYNPVYCEKIGDACGFFRLNAFAHDFLNHQIYPEPKYYPKASLRDADCFAAKYGKPEEVTAAIEFLENRDRYSDVPVYGDPEARADLIRSCAANKS